jgi:hypothetical protein
MTRKCSKHVGAIALAAIVLIAALSPAAAYGGKDRKKLPQVDFAVAAFEESKGRVGIAVKVQRASEVTVVYAGAQSEAVKVVATTFWWDTEFDAIAQDCYRIVVQARNEHGAVSRRIGAGRLGTAGCADCGDAELSVSRARHKVKKAKAAVRKADSARDRRAARHRLRKAKARLARAEQRLDVCLS